MDLELQLPTVCTPFVKTAKKKQVTILMSLLFMLVNFSVTVNIGIGDFQTTAFHLHLSRTTVFVSFCGIKVLSCGLKQQMCFLYRCTLCFKISVSQR